MLPSRIASQAVKAKAPAILPMNLRMGPAGICQGPDKRGRETERFLCATWRLPRAFRPRSFAEPGIVGMPTLLDPSVEDELPAPSAAHVISRVIVEAWLRSVDRKEGRRFLENLGAVLETQEDLAHVVPIRGPRAQQAAQAEREALAAIRQMLGVWMSSLPPKSVTPRAPRK